MLLTIVHLGPMLISDVRSRRTMSGQIRRRIRREVSHQFQLERASLFRLEKEEKLRRGIARDRGRLFQAFKERLGSDGLELANCLKRLVMNFSVLASYRGIV